MSGYNRNNNRYNNGKPSPVEGDSTRTSAPPAQGQQQQRYRPYSTQPYQQDTRPRYNYHHHSSNHGGYHNHNNHYNNGNNRYSRYNNNNSREYFGDGYQSQQQAPPPERLSSSSSYSSNNTRYENDRQQQQQYNNNGYIRRTPSPNVATANNNTRVSIPMGPNDNSKLENNSNNNIVPKEDTRKSVVDISRDIDPISQLIGMNITTPHDKLNKFNLKDEEINKTMERLLLTSIESHIELQLMINQSEKDSLNVSSTQEKLDNLLLMQ